MLYTTLGNTDITVSRLCLGTLTMGRLQKSFSIKDAERVVGYAIDKGITFFDTAELYGSYHVTAAAVRAKKDVIIATKSYAYDRRGAEKALTDCLKALGRDYVDIFLLHETESLRTIRGHWDAVDYYLHMKDKGYLRAAGISSHHVAAANDIRQFDGLDILHPMINYKGMGILDGTADDMAAAIKAARASGRGVYAMKAFGGGHLLPHYAEAAAYINSLEGIDSVAVGLQSEREIDTAVFYFGGNAGEGLALPSTGGRGRSPAIGRGDLGVPKSPLSPNGDCPPFNKGGGFVGDAHPSVPSVDLADKRVRIHDWCCLCGGCAALCPQSALTVTDRVAVDHGKCVLCGYCGAGCSSACIKIF